MTPPSWLLLTAHPPAHPMASSQLSTIVHSRRPSWLLTLLAATAYRGTPCGAMADLAPGSRVRRAAAEATRSVMRTEQAFGWESTPGSGQDWQRRGKVRFEFIIREDSGGSKRVLAATAQQSKFPHATEFVGRLLATTIFATEVHELDLLVHMLTTLVPRMSVVPQIRGHQNAQFFVVCVRLVRRIRVTITDRPLEARESLSGQTLF